MPANSSANLLSMDWHASTIGKGLEANDFYNDRGSCWRRNTWRLPETQNGARSAVWTSIL